MAKNLLQLKLDTVPNGYSLKIEGEDYMYYNLADLIAGFVCHVGLMESKPMDRGTVLSTLFTAMIGEEYANSVTTLKRRVGLLSQRYETTLERMDESIDYVVAAGKQIESMKQKIELLDDKVSTVQKLQSKVEESIKEADKKVRNIDKKSKEVLDDLSNSATIMKAIEETGKAKKGKKDIEDDVESSDPVAGTDGVKKANGRRKKADEAILRQLESMAKDNPNLK